MKKEYIKPDTLVIYEEMILLAGSTNPGAAGEEPVGGEDTPENPEVDPEEGEDPIKEYTGGWDDSDW